MLKKPGIRKLFKIFKFPSHFHVTLTAGIITLHFIFVYFESTSFMVIHNDKIIITLSNHAFGQ